MSTIRDRAHAMFDLRSPRPSPRRPLSQRPRLDESDVLVALATRGDPDAIASVFVELGDVMLEEARAALGPRREHAAADVVQDFLEQLLHRNAPRFDGGPGDGIPFLRRAVRAVANRPRRGRRRHAAR